MRRVIVVGALSALLPSVLSGPVAAQTPVGTAFTYQGRLTNTGSAVDGPVDLKFSVFAAASGGSALATTTVPAVQVTSGLFTVSLDFGSSPFSTGEARWLEIQVSPPGGPVLAPRQRLTPTPYATFSSYTDPAHLASLNAGNITSGTVPSAALGGTYSNAVTLSSPGNVFAGDGSGLTNLNAQAKYVRTVVVGPVGAGTPSANGTALLAALAGITGATSVDHWLLKIEPGLYDAGALPFVMKPFVDVEGSGELATRIRGTGNAANNVGTVQAVTNSELRFLSVENTGGAAYAKALYVSNAAPRITHVTAIASGATTESQGFFSEGSSVAILTDVTAIAIATGGANGFATLDVGSSSQMFHVVATANGGGVARGLYVCCGGAPTMRDSTGTALGATVENHGVSVYDSSPTLERVTGNATGGANRNLGLLITGAAAFPVVRDVVGHAAGAVQFNWGLLANFGAQPNVNGVVADASGGLYAHAVEYDSTGVGASLSRVRVGGSNGTNESVGLRINNASPRVVDVDAFASGSAGSVYGVHLAGSSPAMSRVTSSAGGATSGNVIGVYLNGSSAPTLTHVTSSGTGVGGDCYGLGAQGAGLVLDDAFLSAACPGLAEGVFVAGDGLLTSVTALASGGSTNFGAELHDPTGVRIAQARFEAQTAAFSSGLYLSGSVASTAANVERSTAIGTTNSVVNAGTATVRVGESELGGLASNSGTGTLTCLRAYNPAFVLLGATCN